MLPVNTSEPQFNHAYAYRHLLLSLMQHTVVAIDLYDPMYNDRSGKTAGDATLERLNCMHG